MGLRYVLPPNHFLGLLMLQFYTHTVRKKGKLLVNQHKVVEYFEKVATVARLHTVISPN